MDALLDRFVSTSSELRAAIRSEEADLLPWTRRVRNGVAGVYLAAALLPRGEVTTDVNVPHRPASAADQAALASELAERLGDADAYVEVWDPTGALLGEKKPMKGSISRHLAEIDSDLAEALEWISIPHDNLLRDLRFAFEEHWGKHAVDVLRPLHLLASGRVG